MRVDNLPRRDFLKTASLFAGAVAVAPEKTFAQDSADDVILRFAVTCDTHFPGSFYPGFFPGNSQETQRSRLAKAIRLAVDYASAQPYDRLDAFAVCGDMTNRGVEEELVPFCETLDAALPADTRRVLCMGSHEYMGGSRELWEKICKTPGNRRQEIGGFQFITLSPDDTCETDGVYKNRLEWVERELEAAVAEGGPERPIFFFQHYHVTRPETPELLAAEPQWLKGRRTTRCHKGPQGASDLFPIFEKFPQLIDFSGHSHYPISDPGVVWQGKFTLFGCGTLTYGKFLEPPYDTTPEDRYEYAQFYIVEVSRDFSVRLRIMDLPSESLIAREYRVERPADPTCRPYSDARIETFPTPVWGPGAGLWRDERPSDGGSFRFPQAQNVEDVQSYRVVLVKKSEPEKIVAERLLWSKFYRNPQPDKITFSLTNLDSKTDYHMEVVPINFFGKQGETPLTLDFTT